MPRIQLPPTKSSLLTLRRQLAFAEEGYDLLEQKRQILALELMSRLPRIRATEQHARGLLRQAYSLLQTARLRSGAAALDRATVGASLDHQILLDPQRLPGLNTPRVTLNLVPPRHPLCLSATPIQADLARRRVLEALPVLAELAELQTAVVRLSRELQRTQRRCNALSRIFIPDYRRAIAGIAAALEERERESFTILKRIRDRTGQRDASRTDPTAKDPRQL